MLKKKEEPKAEKPQRHKPKSFKALLILKTLGFMQKNIKLISGTANKPLAEIAKLLKIPLTVVDTRKFQDGRYTAESLKASEVRCYIIQPTSSPAR